MICDASSRNAVLYQTLGCHLCEVAAEMIGPLAVARGWQVELKEISEDEALLSRYGIRIPVLLNLQSGAELDWPFGIDQIAELLC